MSGDLTAPETFTNMVTADSIMKRMIPTTVLLFLISALLFSVLRRRRHAGHRRSDVGVAVLRAHGAA